MNKKLIITLFVFALVSITSCKKFLDITPKQQFTSGIATSSLDGLQNTTIGAFNQLQSSNLYGGGIIANSEFMADFINAGSISDYSLNQFRARQLDANNSQSGGMWSDAYRAIYIANVVLQALPNFQSQNPALVQTLKGECFFIRGIMHFELVRMFAQPSGFTSDDSHLGVPIVLVPGDITHGQSTPRSTVAQCYAQITSDLDSAIALLPTSSPPMASQASAQAFLTRVYFTQNKFQQAYDMANTVINTSGASMVDSLQMLYGSNIDGINSSAFGSNTNNTEALFQDISVATDIANQVCYGRFTWIPFHPGQCYMSDAFAPYYRADSASGGKRWREGFRTGTTSGGSSGPRVYWCNKYNNNNSTLNIIRLAEIYLDAAESAAQLGKADQEVRTDINAIRTHRGLLADNTTSGATALINAARAERDMELAVEGDRLFEIKRRKINFVAPESGQAFQWNSPALVYPIPLQEVRQNPNMVQNPGY